jgi:Oxysterol-binding protein
MSVCLSFHSALGSLDLMCVCLSHSSSTLRTCKPFNPLLGETFEWQPEAGTRFVCEQVAETNRTQLFLFGMHNMTFGPHLAAIHMTPFQ